MGKGSRQLWVAWSHDSLPAEAERMTKNVSLQLWLGAMDTGSL